MTCTRMAWLLVAGVLSLFWFSTVAAAQGTLHEFFGTQEDRFGQSVSLVGDVNGDGYGDIVVGSPYDDTNGQDSGTVSVYSGATGALIRANYGLQPFDSFGLAVSGGGDVDGDGFVDYLAGTPWSDLGGHDVGLVRVFSGKTGAVLSQVAHPSSKSSTNFGATLSGLGDIDGDGLGDFAIGASDDSTSGVNAGAAYIYSGRTGSVVTAYFGGTILASLGFSISRAGLVRVLSGQTGKEIQAVQGASASQYFGDAIDGGIDLNLDGFTDYVVGAPQDSGAGSYAGLARVYSGICGAVFGTHGYGCPGTGGLTPKVTVAGCLTPGGNATVEITQGLGGGTALLFASSNMALMPLGHGCYLNLWPPIGPFGPVALSSGGSLSIPLKIPVTATTGFMVIQVLVLDPGSAFGASSTEGLDLLFH